MLITNTNPNNSEIVTTVTTQHTSAIEDPTKEDYYQFCEEEGIDPEKAQSWVEYQNWCCAIY